MMNLIDFDTENSEAFDGWFEEVVNEYASICGTAVDGDTSWADFHKRPELVAQLLQTAALLQLNNTIVNIWAAHHLDAVKAELIDSCKEANSELCNKYRARLHAEAEALMDPNRFSKKNKE